MDEHIGRNSWNYQHAFSADVILCEYNNACLLYQLGLRELSLISQSESSTGWLVVVLAIVASSRCESSFFQACLPSK